MPDLFDNPMGTDGFEFVEFCDTDPTKLDKVFREMGFRLTAWHKSLNVTLYQQGGINFILNAGQEGFSFATAHNGDAANAMGFRVKDAAAAMKYAVSKGAKEVKGHSLPAIEGIGGLLIFLIEKYGDKGSVYESEFNFKDKTPYTGAGLTYIDHLTHNLQRGHMAKWAEFYERIFNFREIRYFDIEGKLTGLKSKAMTSPCGKIRIPLNEFADDKSQIEEFLKRYNGEGIQHIALGTGDIFDTVTKLTASGVLFQKTPDTYYKKIDARVPGHSEDLKRMQDLGILIDGAPTKEQGLLLQIFTQDEIGPIFFEIIQRKGNEGFGEGNFQALFEALEDDQIRRGVLKN